MRDRPEPVEYGPVWALMRFPWRDGIRVRPQASLRLSCILFQASYTCILRLLPVPPGQSCLDKFSTEIRAIGQDHIAHGAPVSVFTEDLDRDFLAVGEGRRELLGFLAAGLFLLRAVDAVESDALSLAVVEHVNGVSVDHADDLAGEGGS